MEQENFDELFEESCDLIDEANRIIERELQSGNYDDTHELHSRPVHDWLEGMIAATAKQQVDAEVKLLHDLWQIRMSYGDGKRSLAALVHEKDPSKKLVYQMYETEHWFEYGYFVIDDPSWVGAPKLSVNYYFAPFGCLVLKERAAEGTINTISREKSNFKRFVLKRRK